jgi:hypothetical protein
MRIRTSTKYVHVFVVCSGAKVFASLVKCEEKCLKWKPSTLGSLCCALKWGENSQRESDYAPFSQSWFLPSSVEVSAIALGSNRTQKSRGMGCMLNAIYCIDCEAVCWTKYRYTVLHYRNSIRSTSHSHTADYNTAIDFSHTAEQLQNVVYSATSLTVQVMLLSKKFFGRVLQKFSKSTCTVHMYVHHYFLQYVDTRYLCIVCLCIVVFVLFPAFFLLCDYRYLLPVATESFSTKIWFGILFYSMYNVKVVSRQVQVRRYEIRAYYTEEKKMSNLLRDFLFLSQGQGKVGLIIYRLSRLYTYP